MNRVIKFRAWNKQYKHMAYQGTPDLENIQSFMFHYGLKELMQFTGLHDKNGKDIYEGDIVKVLDDDYVPENIGIVVWGGDYPAFTIKGSSFEDLEYNSLQHACYVVECEVIGNIYENPELIPT